jgi:hypothetical protein
MTQVHVNIYPDGFFYQGVKTAVATDTIKVTIPPMAGDRICILGGQMLASSTAHKSYFMYPNKQTTLSAAIAAGAESLFVTDTCYDAAGGAPAAGDIYVIQCNNGTYAAVTCSVQTNYKKIYFKSAEATAMVAASKGNMVWGFGAPGDANCETYQLTASSLNSYPSAVILGKINCPMIFRSSSKTAVDTLEQMSAAYLPR